MFPIQDGSLNFRDSPHLLVDSRREFSVVFSTTHRPLTVCDWLAVAKCIVFLLIDEGLGEGKFNVR